VERERPGGPEPAGFVVIGEVFVDWAQQVCALEFAYCA
jgi:hypothetical protein